MLELLPRIREILQWCDLGPAAFADEIGVARPVISHVVSARNKASLEVVQKILARFPDISPAWLMLGDGAMLKGLEPESAKKVEVPTGSQPSKDSEEKPERKEKVQEAKIPPSASFIAKPSEGKQLIKVILFYSDGSFEKFGNSL